MDTALMRAVFSVPGHFLFAVAMGYSFAKYGYYKKGKIYLLEAFIAAYIIHGLYNIIIMAAGKYYLLLFLPYLLVLWRISLKKIYILSIKSPFKNK